MRQVKLRGHYDQDKYYIKDPSSGKHREVLRNTISNVNAVDLPRIRRTEGEPGTESSIDGETRDELELAETCSEPGGEEILREVIGQATDVMRRQLRGEGVTDSDDDSEFESGNASSF